MKKILILIFLFISLNAQAEDTVGKIIGDTKEGINKSITSLFDKFSNFSKVNISPEKFENKTNVVLNQINEDCCAESFNKKERLIEIKTLLEDCLNSNCHKKKVLIITKKNKKLIALNAIDEADDLLFENIKLVYNEDLINQKKLYDEQIKNNSKLLAEFNKAKKENEEKIKKNNDILEKYKIRNNKILEQYEEDLSENKDQLNLTSAQLSALQDQNDNLEEILKEMSLINKENIENYEARIAQITYDYETLLNNNENQKINFNELKIKMDNRIKILTVENNNMIKLNQALNENLVIMEKDLKLMLEDLPPYDKKKWKEKLDK